MDDATLLITW